MAYLERPGKEGNARFVLHGDRLTLGRGNAVALELDGDPGVSRLHALLEHLDGGWRISDLGSSNGTFVNGTRLTGPIALRPGDTVLVGSSELVFVDEAASDDGTFLDGDAPDPLVAPPPLAALSNRERDVLGLLARGDTDEQIAAELFISVATVRSHLDRIRDKTGCRRRPELTRLAVEQGIVPPRRTDVPE